MATLLSPHFTLEELTLSAYALRTGIDNIAPTVAVKNLTELCTVLLEPARALLGVPLHVDSGYRCYPLNKAIGGAQNSAHVYGLAADVIPIGMDLGEAFETLRTSDLPYDQIIFECNAWIHLALPPVGVARRQALTASGGPGHWSYTLVPDGEPA